MSGVKFYLKFRKFVLLNLTKLFFRREIAKQPKTIVIFRSCLLGDFLFALPAINLMRKNFPNAEIIFLTTFASSKKTISSAGKYLDTSIPLPWFDFILPNLIDKVINVSSFDRKHLSTVRKYIKEKNPDLFVLLPQPADTFISQLKKIIFFKVIGVRKNFFGWNTKGDYSVYREKQNKMGLFGHKIFGPLGAVDELKKYYTLVDVPIEFPITLNNGCQNWAKSLTSNMDKGLLKIGLSVSSIHKHKQWSVENFVSLSKLLDKQYNCQFFILGTTGHENLFNFFDVHEFSYPPINLIGKTDVFQLAALLKNLNILVTNDGGAAHLGAALGLPIISIISGIEYSNSIEPWGNFEYAVRNPTECSPCYSMTECPLGHNSCMVDLSVVTVLDKVNLAIEQRGF